MESDAPDELSDRAKAVRYDRLVAMATEAARHETREWAKGTVPYFVAMASIRSDPDLWFGGASNGKVRAEAISKSLTRAVSHAAAAYRSTDNNRGARK